jgi:cytoskeletal protein RodZ
MPQRDDLHGKMDRDILDIIPERFDSDADSRQARKSAFMRVVLTISLAVLLVAALGVAARHILFGDAPHDHQISVPVIHADDKPIKVKPQERGGMDVPNQDKLVYERMGAKTADQQPERLLPPPEQPQTPPQTPPQTSPQVPPQAMTAAPANTPSAPPPPVAAPSPAVSKPQISAPAAPVPAPAKVAVVQPSAPPAKTAVVPPSVPSKAGGWVVQLGAVKSETEAKTEWTRLKSAHKEELADLASDIVRVDLGAKGIFWRVRGGALDEAQARLLCAQLIKQGQGCIIARK